MEAPALGHSVSPRDFKGPRATAQAAWLGKDRAEPSPPLPALQPLLSGLSLLQGPYCAPQARLQVVPSAVTGEVTDALPTGVMLQGTWWPVARSWGDQATLPSSQAQADGGVMSEHMRSPGSSTPVTRPLVALSAP